MIFAGLVAAVLVPLLWGWHPHVPAGMAMSPAVRSTDVVLVAPTDADIELGSILEFEIGGETLLERVVGVEADHYLTAPDALLAAGQPIEPIDAQIVERDEVRGVGKVVVPWIGLPVVLFRQASWLALTALVVGVSVVVAFSSRRWVDQRPEMERS